jgi:hypothetical protein
MGTDPGLQFRINPVQCVRNELLALTKVSKWSLDVTRQMSVR